MNFFRQIFQDVNGSFSSKRTAFFIFILMFTALTGAVLCKGVPAAAVDFAKGTQEKLVDLIKWLGGFIVGEQVAKFAPDKDPK